jgi:hypothetical protein
MERWQEYEQALSPEAMARRRAFRNDLEVRVRKTAEGDDARKFLDGDPTARAQRVGGDALHRFNEAVTNLSSAGIPNGMANVLAEVLHLPAGNIKPSASNADPSASDDAGHLTDSERATLLALIPSRSKHSSARVSDDDVMDTLDRLLTMRRLKLRSRDMADWPKLKARTDQLAQRGAFDAIASALGGLDISDTRRRALRSLCEAMAKRKSRLADLKAERAKAGRY